MLPLVLESACAFEEDLVATLVDPSQNPNRQGLICVSVAEEQAMDSYNATFRCSIHLTKEQVASLHAWLGSCLKEAS